MASNLNPALSIEEYQLLAEYSTDVISKLAIDGTILYISSACYGILGYRPDEMIGKLNHDFFHPDDARIESVRYMPALEHSDATRMTHRMRQKNGDYVWIETMNRLVRDAEGKPSKIICASRDITTRKMTQDALRMSESTLKSFFNANSLLMGVTELDGEDLYVVTANEAALQRMGKKIEDFQRYSMADLGFSMDYVNFWRGHYLESEQLRRPVTFEYHDDKFDCWFSATINYIGPSSHDRKRYSFLVQEITERVKAQIQSNHNAKMASLGEMAGGLAHEINNPLAIIKGKTQQVQMLMERDEDVKDKVRHHLTVIDSTVDRIAKIIKGLRNFARESNQDPNALVKVMSIVEDTLAFCSARFRGHEVDLQIHCTCPEINLECRSVQISQVLLNLLNNAFDAVQDLETKWVKVLIDAHEDGVQICVEDSGCGISQHLREKVMQPFFTTKGVGKGTGLGLSISKGLVEGHSGRLFIDSNSQTTKFVFWLPLRANVVSRKKEAI